MADNEGHLEECSAQQDDDRRGERLSASRIREQRMTKTKGKTIEGHLPTPPPDPWRTSACLRDGQNQAEMTRPRSLEEEEDIIAYLADLGTPPFESQNSECPSRNSATSTMAVASLCTEEAFEHLDRLYALTEQILDLRTRSSRFFRRVRDLERLKVLRNADRRLESIFARDKDLITGFNEEDTGFAESLLDAMLSNCRDLQAQRRNVRSPSSRRRSRSLALSEQSLPRLSAVSNRFDVEKQTSRNDGANGSPKVSKWTRVKAAFKWERACANDMLDTADPSSTTPSTPTTKYLRIPETGVGNWSGSTVSSCASEVSGPSTPFGRVSSASSSNEGSYDGPRKNASSLHSERQSLKSKEDRKKVEPSRRSRSLDGDTIMTDAANDAANDAERTSETSQGKPLIRITSDNNAAMNSSQERNSGATSKKQTPTLTITIPSNEEEIRSVSSPESISPLLSSAQNSGGNSPQPAKSRQESSAKRDFKRQRSTIEEPVTPAPKMQRQDSKWNKVRRAFLTNSAFSVPPSPVRIVSGQLFLHGESETPKAHSCNGSVEDLDKSTSSNAQADTRRDYQVLWEKLDAEFHRKLVEWERLKNVSPRVNARAGARESVSGGGALNPREGLLPEERLAPEFKKKLQDWKRAKKGRRGSATFEQQRVSRRRLTDWQLWRSPSKPDTRNQDTIGSRGSCGSGGSAGSIVSDARSHLCEDFVRRMEAWRRMNETSPRATEAPKWPDPKRFRVASGIDESEFQALEKVLLLFGERIGRERRDSDARQLDECFDGDNRLVDGSQSANSGNEVLIRTSVGSYRFEGISREFTRKLYDWEKYRGISPRSSTFRLLGPAYATFMGGERDNEASAQTAATTKIADEEKMFYGILKRSKSVGNVIEERPRIRCEPLARRSMSLQSLNRLAKRLEDADRADTSPAPTDPRGTRDTSEDVAMDDSEPEAMIVDIEDVIEETASPLKRVQPHQTPVYSVAASETTSIAVPLGTVASSREPSSSPAFLVEVQDSSDRKHWESRTWSRRKNFSSEDSPSPERFDEVARAWNERSDSLAQDDVDSEHSTPSESWDRKECCVRDSFERYDLREWSRADRSDRDKDSVKSDRSMCSSDWNPKSRTANEIRVRCYVDFEREELPAVSSDGERASVKSHRLGPVEKDENKSIQTTELRNHSAISEDTKESMDLSDEKTHEHEFRGHEEEEEEEEEDRSDDEEEDTLQDETKTDNEYEQIIPDNAVSYSCGLADTRSMADYRRTAKIMFKSLTDEEIDTREQPTAGMDPTGEQGEDDERRNKNYGVIRDESQTRRYEELSKVTSASRNGDHRNNTLDASERSTNPCEDPNSSTDEQDNCIKANLMFAKPTHANESPYHNYETVSTSFAHTIDCSTSTSDYHSGPTIRTTPLTVTSCRGERCYERIIINEKTLNKIVVPTSSAYVKDRSEDENYRDTSVNRDTSVKKNGSPTRNVFVKTKRMIFSPFWRTEDRSVCRNEGDNCNDDRALRSKTKSKSRSASPKISRQDVLSRMPLSLPWPLRASSKDDEARARTKIEGQSENDRGRTMIEKQASKRYKSGYERERSLNGDIESLSKSNLRRESQVERQVQTTEDESESPLARADAPFRAAQMQQQNRTFDTLNSCSIIKETETESSSLRSEPVSSDLIHKLNILSNAAARRDGRTNTISVDPPLESHSSRIRRAKENFLSRRGGPLCYSAVEPQKLNLSTHSFTRTITPDDHYEKLSEKPRKETPLNEELSTGAVNREGTEEISINEGTESDEAGELSIIDDETGAPRPEASTASRPDLVKSASAGMINVDPDTFGRLAEPNRGCESLPRTIWKRRESSGPFAKIVNKFKLSRLIRGSKDSDEGNMSTISRLCRQSLLIDVRSDFEEHREGHDQDVSEEHPRMDDNDTV